MGEYRKGMRFRTRREMQARGIIAFGAPCSSGFDGVLSEGVVLILNNEPPDFESIFVPERNRTDPDYAGYALACSYDQVGTDLELLI